MNLEDIQNQLVAINIGSEDAPELLREVMSHAKSQASVLRDLTRHIEQAIIEHIETTGLDIELLDGKRWYVGKDKIIKSNDDTAVMHAVLDATGGDVAKFTTGADGVLASSPWKFGAVKTLLGEDRFATLFTTTYKTSLETGKTIKVLKVADPAFQLKGGVA